MKLPGDDLAHVNSIAHEGKVLLFATDSTGIVWYTVKQSGFEDSVFNASNEATNGFEAWKKLPLGESTYDASTAQKFSSLLVPVFGKDQAGKENSQAVKSALAPVQLVSGMGHLHVFRQSTDRKLLVSRFILDGMTNELMPKLDVRFKRSRQKYEVSESMKMEKDTEGNAALKNVDAPDFKDMDGNPFYEPTWKLEFIENLEEGWFSAILVSTIEKDKFRWNIFAYDRVAKKIILYTVRASHSGIFDVKDYFFLQPDPKNSQKKTMRTIHGIIKRTLDIKTVTETSSKALVVNNGLAATAYNLQRERFGDDGEAQFLKDATRVMLAVPVKEKGDDVSVKTKTAVVSFAVGSDGTLSEVDDTPLTTQISAETNELVLPLNTLEEVKEFYDTNPAPSGVMKGVKKSSVGTVTILSKNVPETMEVGENVKISGTKSYNGLHKVLRVIEEEGDTKSFEIATTFNSSEAGFWEVVPKTSEGLTFDNMVVSHQKAGDNLLKITCSNHDLEIGDEVQVKGTRGYDGVYPIKDIDEINNNFTIGMDYQSSEAVDLKKKRRRGIRFGGRPDYLRTDSLKIDRFTSDTNGGRTFSVWVWLESVQSHAQLIVSQDNQNIGLTVDADGKMQFHVRLSDSMHHIVKDPDLLPVRTWVHYAGIVEYISSPSAETHLSLCKNGVKVTPTPTTGEIVVDKTKVIVDHYPTRPPTMAFAFSGTKKRKNPDTQTIVTTTSTDYPYDIPFSSLTRFDFWKGTVALGDNLLPSTAFTLEFWVYPMIDDNSYHLIMGNNRISTERSPSVYIYEQTKIHAGYANQGSEWKNFTTEGGALTKSQWNHVAVTFNSTSSRFKIYVNGVEKLNQHCWGTPKSRSVEKLAAGANFKGHLQEVRIWNKELSGTEIMEHKYHRIKPTSNLQGYYQFDKITGTTLPDQSENGNNGHVSESLDVKVVPTLTLKENRTTDAIVITPGLEVTVPKEVAVTIPVTIPDTAFTLAFWIKTSQDGNINLVSYTPSFTRSGFSFSFSRKEFAVTNPDALQIYVGNSAVSSNISVNDGEWHHLAFSWESENGILVGYKDGEEAFCTTSFQKGYNLSQNTTASLVLGVQGNVHLEGSLGQLSLWSKILSIAEVKRLMESSLTGEEKHLVGAWVHSRNMAYDLTENQKHGVVYDDPDDENIEGLFSKLSSKIDPIRLLVGGTGDSAVSFAGKLSDLRVWSIAQDENTIKDNIHVLLSGREDKLAGNWLMGAIVTEKGVRYVPDFSTQANNALVYGSPFVSERSLNRSNAASQKIVKYANDELVAVSHRAYYRESFEFKIQGANDDAWTLDKLNDAEGKKNNARIFQFGYWGKASRSSGKTISFPTELWNQDEFTAVDGAQGWFRASCDFTVPDDVSMVRSFGILNVKGLWGNEDSPPTEEWTTMEVRKHQIEHISDAITRKDYSDDIRLAALGSGASGTLYELWEEIRSLELCEADISRHLQNIMLRIDIAESKTKYQKEKSAKERERASVQSEIDRLTARATFLEKEIERLGASISTRSRAFDFEISSHLAGYNYHIGRRDAEENDRKYWLDCSRDPFNTGYDLRKMAAAIRRKSEAQSSADNDRENLENAKKEKNREIGNLSSSKTTHEQELSNVRRTRKPQLQSQWDILDRRVKLLAKFLRNPEDLTRLGVYKTTTKNGLDSVRTSLNAKNQEFLNTIAQNQQQPQEMTDINTDTKELTTKGALLTFVSPKSRLHALESSRGNVELNYFDSLNNMQCTVYDATADSRNATFQQWLPGSLRPCLEFRESSDKMYLEDETSVALTDKWTLETWFHYPLVAKPSGDAYETQVLVEDIQARQIVVQAGRYLGAQAGGVFFETAIDLKKVIAQGWHHLAVTLEKDNGLSFFLDGRKQGSTPKKYAITFHGNNIIDYVKWSNFANFPTTKFTLSMWVKTLGRNSNPSLLSYGTTAQIRSLHLQDVNPLTIWLGGVSYTTKVSLDDGFWHHLSITWESGNGGLYLYKDGILVDNKAGFRQGISIGTSGILVLGQGQSSLEPGFQLNQAFDGSLRGLSIWNVARNGEDIKRDMYTTFQGTETNLIGYWPMETVEDGGKLKIKDLSSFSKQGDVSGTPRTDIVSVINEGAYQIKTIGNSADGGKPFGRLAEMRLWRQVLSDDEVAAHAQANDLTGDEPGLVAYYPMNEAIGTKVRDHATGTKIHGVLSGAGWKACTAEMSKFADESQRRALHLRGSDYVEIPGLRGELGGNEISVEFWFKGTNMRSAVRIDSGTDFLSTGWLGKHIMSNEGGKEDGLSAGDALDEQWHHVAITWKKGTTNGFVSYLDGEVVMKRNSSNTAFPTIQNSVYLGCMNGQQDFTWGQLAEVRIWTMALTKQQIIYNMHRRLTGKETGLKAYYPLDNCMEDEGDLKVRDLTPNEYHGILHAPLTKAEDLFLTGDLLTTDDMGKFDVLYFNGRGAKVDCGTFDIANKTFSFECWVKNGQPSSENVIAAQGRAARSKGLSFGFLSSGKLFFSFYSGHILTSTASYSDRDWHHFAATYDHTSRTRTLYRDGVKVGQITGDHYSGTGNLYLGCGFRDYVYFKGCLGDIRLWSCCLSHKEVNNRKSLRLSGKEPSLIGYWPIGDLADGKLKDRSTGGTNDGEISGARLVGASGSYPFPRILTNIPLASISACEYATMGLDVERPTLKTCMLRNFRTYSTKIGDIRVLCDQRIEALDLKWVGNAQFQPTLLGFIEGPPPIPSENLTVDYDYDNATSVTLRESQDVSYTWNRTKDTSHGLDLDLFVGAGWGVAGGIGIETKISEGRVGFKGSLNTRFVNSNSSSVTSGSTISFSDTLALRGEQENGTQFSHIGKRFMPKNVGYALVVSGLADIFVSRLARSGRMISYEMRPVEGVPLDINTITFQINSSYLMNGSLDGLTGSQATNERFFRHVPEMRSQYGSLYPASYYRIKEAYDLKSQIARWDKDREAYFWNFDVTWRPGVDPGRQIADPSEEGSFGQVTVEREEDTPTEDGDNKSEAQAQNAKLDKLQGDMEKEKEKAKAKAAQRKDEIQRRFKDPEARERAASALDGWQSKMENLLIRAGKRNIVNTYVWDANGGLRAENQDFANMVEHTIGSNFTIGGTLGGLVDAQISAFQLDLTALYAGELTQTSSKTENIGKTFGLDIDLHGVESKEVLDMEGKPLKPGEKVSRYRFMSFYLGGNTDNFHDFFDYVVDPEWLLGNSEGARALRQAKEGKPNKAWRVLHRVTYVERPSLEGIGVDTRPVSNEDQITDRAVSYFDALERQNRADQADLAVILAELRSLQQKVDTLSQG